MFRITEKLQKILLLFFFINFFILFILSFYCSYFFLLFHVFHSFTFLFLSPIMHSILSISLYSSLWNCHLQSHISYFHINLPFDFQFFKKKKKCINICFSHILNPVTHTYLGTLSLFLTHIFRTLQLAYNILVEITYFLILSSPPSSQLFLEANFTNHFISHGSGFAVNLEIVEIRQFTKVTFKRKIKEFFNATWHASDIFNWKLFENKCKMIFMWYILDFYD